MAYAGSTARADDPDTVAANPAGMTHLAGTQFSFGVQHVAGRAEPRVPNVSRHDAQEDQTLPYLYVSHALNERWAVGLAVNSPYALETRYGAADAAALGVSQTKVSSQRISPAVAYRVSDLLSIGLALNYEHLAVDWNSPAQTYQAAGDGLGWQLGALWDLAPYMRLGVSYRSAVQHHLSGDLSGVRSTSHLNTPESLTFSVWQSYTDEWEAGGEMAYTRWSQVDRIAPVQANLNYRDSWRFAWGAAYRHSDAFKSRFGIAVERSPVVDANRTARWPEEHAVWLTLGGQYRLYDKGLLDAGLAWRLPGKPAVANGEYASTGQVLSVQYRHTY